MTLGAVLSEVWRNVGSGTSKAALWSMMVAVVLGGVTVTDIVSVHVIERQAQAFQQAAANVRMIAAAGQVDGRACDGLSRESTVESAGALRARDEMVVEQAPQVLMTGYDVTVGLAGVLGIAHPEPDGVWVEARLAQALGVQVGAVLSTTYGVMPVAAVFAWPDDGRDARLQFAVLVPQVAAGSFDECWIRAWPVADGNDRLLRSTVNVSAGLTPVVIAPANRTLGSALDAGALYSGRVTRLTNWAAPVFLLGIGFVASWRRRLEYASARHAGQRTGALLAGVALEGLVWAAVGVGIALAVDTLTARVVGMSEPWPMLRVCLDVGLWSLLGCLVGAITGACLIREKDLFRFFKTR